MRIAVMADIQSNVEALKAVLRDARRQKAERLYCCGNIVGYNASPGECVRLVQKKEVVCTQGDYDFAVVTLKNLAAFPDPARAAIMHAVQSLKKMEKQFLAELPIKVTDDQLTMVHGSPRGQDQQVDANGEAKQMASMTGTRFLFIGHTHVPWTADVNGVFIVSPGSVGQPRDGDWRASYAMVNTETATASIRRVAYDVRLAGEKIIKAGLPSVLAERLQKGV